MDLDTVGAILITATLIMDMVTATPIMELDGAILIMDMVTHIMGMEEDIIQVMVTVVHILTILAEEAPLMEVVITQPLPIIEITPVETALTIETMFLALAETTTSTQTEHLLLSPIEIATLPLEIIKDKTETAITKREQIQTVLPDKITAHQIVPLRAPIIHTEIAVAECLAAVAECLAVVEVAALECLAAAEEDNIYLLQTRNY